MTSVLHVDTIADKAGTGPVALTKQHAAKSWAQFENDPVLNDSFNFSSITDNTTGDHSLSYTSNMSSTAYAVMGCGTVDDGSYQVFVAVDHDRGGPRAAGIDVNVVSDGGGFTDAELLSIGSHGDLA